MMVRFMVILLAACFQQLWPRVSPGDIILETCPPPDYPQSGGYGPVKDLYLPGDVIHYFCDTETYMGGNFLRICLDSGDWSGDTPVCDHPADFSLVEQSSTAEPADKNDAGRASDGNRTTCSKTLSESGAYWTAILNNTAREAIRFMLYLPKGEVDYEVLIVKSDESEVICGRSKRNIVIYEWIFHNCLQPNNTDVTAVKMRSLSNSSLEICELVFHTLTDPTCVDPHFEVSNGRLILSRKTALLTCNKGYTIAEGSPRQLDCIRTGVWSRRSLRCEKTLNKTLNSTSSRGERDEVSEKELI